MGYSPTEYTEFTEPPAEMSSHGFLLRRVWHLAIPTPLAMGYSPTEYAEFTEPPTEISSHGFHRFTQILRVRCSPTEFTEFTEFGSVGMAGMPYPPTSVRIRVICGRFFSARSFRVFRAHLWESLLCQKFLCVPCVLWEYLFSHGFHRFTQMLRVRFPPTEFTEYTEFVSVGTAGMPYPPTSVNIRVISGRFFSARGSVSSVLICGRLFSARSFCAFRAFCGNIFSPTEFTEFTEFVSVGTAGMPYPPTSVRICAIRGRLFSARGSVYSVLICGRFFSARSFCAFRAFCGNLFSPTEFTEFGSVGMAGMPYPPTSVRICAICGRLFSARGSVYSVHSVGASSPLVRLVQLRQLHPLAESTEIVCKSHPFTSNPAFCMSSQYCGYDFVTTCGSLMRSPGNTIAAGANAIAMRWSS